MRRGRGTPPSPAARTRARRGRLLYATGLIVAIAGVVHGALQYWGDLAWFRLEQPDAPPVWWALPTNLIFWTFGAGVLWALVAGFLAENERNGDRRRWWLGFPGLALAAVVALAGSYVASRQGMALYPDRLSFRSAVLAPLEVVPEDRLGALVVSCEMVRRPRSVRSSDLIDRPVFHLVLEDGRRLRLAGVRGAGIGDLPQEEWLTVMRRLSALPRRVEARSTECASRVAARFPGTEQPFVRSLFAAPTLPPRDIRLCAPGGAAEACVLVPVRPGPPAPRPA